MSLQIYEKSFAKEWVYSLMTVHYWGEAVDDDDELMLNVLRCHLTY